MKGITARNGDGKFSTVGDADLSRDRVIAVKRFIECPLPPETVFQLMPAFDVPDNPPGRAKKPGLALAARGVPQERR